MSEDLFKNLGVNIAKEVNDALGPSFLPAVLTVVTPGTRDPGNLTAGTQPTEVEHSCRAILDTYSTRLIDGSRIQFGDRNALVLGNSLPTGVIPATGHFITIEGRKHSIINVRRDPASATYNCQARECP